RLPPARESAQAAGNLRQGRRGAGAAAGRSARSGPPAPFRVPGEDGPAHRVLQAAQGAASDRRGGNPRRGRRTHRLGAARSPHRGAGAAVMGIELKTADEIAIMREAGLVVFEVLEELSRLVEPGITLEELDQAAKRETEKRGASCAFKDLYGFPKHICISVND